VRTTGVKLIAETSLFRRKMREAAGDVEDLNDELGKTNQSRELDETAKQAETLSKRIRETETNVQSLAKSIAATGGDDSGLIKQLRQQQGLLRQLKNVEKLLPSPAELTAGVTSSMKAVVGPIGGIFAAGVAPLIGATISGAIIAGAALGAAGIGVAIASQDQRVQSAAKRVGDSIKSQLQGAAVPFVQSTIGALNIVESRFLRMNGTVERIMRNAATFLEPLASGVADFMAPVLSGVDALVAKASPVIEAIRRGLGEVGRAIGDVFRSLADNGVEAGMAIAVVFHGIEQAIRIVGSVINGLTEAFGWLVKVADKLGFLSDEGKEKLTGLRGATDQMTGASKAGTSVQGGFMAAIKATGTASQSAAVSLTGLAAATAVADARTKELTQSSDELFGSQMSLDRASLAVRNGMAVLSAELTKGTRTLSLNSEEGRKNRSAVLDQLAAIESLRQSRIKHGMSLDDAGRKYVKDIDGLRKSMQQAGFTRGQIDGLTGAYRKIPKTVNTAVSSTGVQAVGKQLIALQAYQTALKQGAPVVSIRKQLSSDNADFLKYDTGGRTPRTAGVHEPVGVVHGKEFVFDAKTVRNVDRQAPGFLEEVHATHGLPGYAGGGRVTWPYPVTASKTRIPSRAEAASKVTPDFGGGWPSSPGAVRGDSGRWRRIRAFLESANMGGSFGNGYRRGDPKWHGSGWAVDWMGYNLDGLASRLAAMRPLELIHRTRRRDYAYTRGRNKGSFNNALMEAHRNHIHIAMANGGVIREPVMGVGRSGATYSFGEGGVHERVTPIGPGSSAGGSAVYITIAPQLTPNMHPREVGKQIAEYLQPYLAGGGQINVRGRTVLAAG
jgi:hypothetical protein